MEIPRAVRHPIHGRAQVALPDNQVLKGRTVDIAEGGICLLLDDQIPSGVTYLLRFELFAKGKPNVLIAKAKLVYGVFASQGGFRAGFQFAEEDTQRLALIKSLGAKKPMVAAAAGQAAPPTAAATPETPPAEN